MHIHTTKEISYSKDKIKKLNVVNIEIREQSFMSKWVIPACHTASNAVFSLVIQTISFETVQYIAVKML
jgi:hypothetical protein